MIDLEQFEGHTPVAEVFIANIYGGKSVRWIGDPPEDGAFLYAAPFTDLLAEVKRLREEKAELVGALEMIAGEQPCDDSLMGNADIARAALEKARNHG